MKIFLENIKELNGGIWIGDMNPSEVRLLGNISAPDGLLSVIFIKKSIYDSIKKNLQFEISDVRALNIGTTNTCLIVDGAKIISNNLKIANKINTNEDTKVFRNGDQLFLDEVKLKCPDIYSFAEKTISEIRRHFKGELEKAGKSKKYIETPDNFWTVELRHTVKSLDFTVRGYPYKFKNIKLIELKDDRPGFSRFKIRSVTMLNELISILSQSKSKFKNY